MSETMQRLRGTGRCAVASGPVADDRVCESGCAAPVVGYDSEGVPLCRECLDDLNAQPCCDRCGGEGWIDYMDGDGSDWGEDCPSEENHPIICRACRGTGVTV